MIQTVFKYFVYDYCITILFDKIYKNFIRPLYPVKWVFNVGENYHCICLDELGTKTMEIYQWSITHRASWPAWRSS